MQSKKKAHQDETGLEVAGCRHALAQKAVNMHSGEQYGYPHYLHALVLQPLGINFLWQDVICRYWPWAMRRLNYQQAVATIRPALSIMHSKAHAWDCQVCVSKFLKSSCVIKMQCYKIKDVYSACVKLVSK